MDINKVKELAQALRSAIEVSAVEIRPVSMRTFPHGSCGDAVLLLGTHMIAMGQEPFDYMLKDEVLGEGGNLESGSHVGLRGVSDVAVGEIAEIADQRGELESLLCRLRHASGKNLSLGAVLDSC